MKILHILEDYSLNSGGLRTVVKKLHDKLVYENHRSYIISSNKEDDDNIYKVIKSNNPWLFSKEWVFILDKIYNEEKIEIIHIHGVWMYPQFIAAKFAIKHNIPFIMTPHGMYEPWLWSKSKFKKQAYFKFISKPVFSKANLIHTITEQETKNIKRFFPKTPIIEIPNLIDKNEYNAENYSSSEKYVLYVGRLDPKKGIDILIKAFGSIRPKGFKLKIAGRFNGYKIELEKLIKEFEIEDKVEFLGLIKGENKISVFQNAFVFVAPSHSEVIGMVNLEAAILKTPVITTYQTGLKKQWERNGGYLINPNVDELTNTLKEVFKLSLEERNKKGQLLYEFVLKEYSWEYKTEDWIRSYRSLLNR